MPYILKKFENKPIINSAPYIPVRPIVRKIWYSSRGFADKAHISHLPAAAVAQALHDGINLCFKHLCQFGTVFINSGCFTVVKPGVVEHEPHIIDILPGFLVLTCVQFPLNCGQVNGILHYIKVVLFKTKNAL